MLTRHCKLEKTEYKDTGMIEKYSPLDSLTLKVKADESSTKVKLEDVKPIRGIRHPHVEIEKLGDDKKDDVKREEDLKGESSSSASARNRCSVCGEDVKRKSLKRHLLRHLPGAERVRYHCTRSDKSFAQKFSLSRHEKLHDPDIKKFIFTCSVCGKESKYKWIQEYHVDTHKPKAERQNYPCSVCDQRFVTSSTLRTHQRIHSLKGVIHQCSICDKIFATSVNLQFHKETHLPTNKRIKHSCPTCGKVFVSKASLYVHQKNLHANKLRYKCTTCDKEFNRPDNLFIHEQTHLTKDKRKLWPCTLCDRTFLGSSGLYMHKKTHKEMSP